MIDLDDSLAAEYLAECQDHLATAEAGLLAMEERRAGIDDEAVNRVFRAVHSVKGGAGFFDLTKVRDLAHQTEEVLERIRARKLVPTPERVRVLLLSLDRLREMIQKPAESNRADIADIVAALSALPSDGHPPAVQEGRRLRCLLVEDDFASRLVLQTFLSRYGECHIAVNGKEAVEAFRFAFDGERGYDLICMDIMMPEMDGREAVRQIRALEVAHGILSTSGAKIVMTTALEDVKEVIRCFQELCDAYLMKPIDLAQLRGHMRAFRLIQPRA
ncbi:MAG: response regulator [Bryobacteraceae bacterium]|jgi:two-component system chemotaxis response regulator CheY